MIANVSFIPADWPAPARVYAGTSTRLGGHSSLPYASLNLAGHVGDVPTAVSANRTALARTLSLPSAPCWLNQVHGRRVVSAAPDHCPAADGQYTRQPGTVCAVLTADCLPILLCDSAGECVAALHGGWRGLAAGIIQTGIDAMERDPKTLLAWLGPAIGPRAYEVGPEVMAALAEQVDGPSVSVASGRPAHYLLDLYAVAKQLLRRAGVTAIYGGHFCTFSDAERFYSYRRDGETGRMASLIWMATGLT